MATEQRDARETEDDGFHEIQLSGKQLVFLCMATTVVSIVIFLCGVLVGRGVRPVEPVAEAASVTSEPVSPLPPESPAPAAEAPASHPASAEPALAPAAPPKSAAAAPATPPPAAKTEPAKTEPAPKPEPPKAPPVVAKATPAPTTPEVDDNAPPPPPAKNAAATAPASAGSGGAIAVQVGALREKSEAEALARRLSGKGYAAYIVAPPDAGAANAVYRVRVGNYSSQDEATKVKRRLEQEEKLKPWIIR